MIDNASEISERKRVLRAEALSRRAALDPKTRSDAAAHIAANGLPIDVPTNAIISGWIAMGAELDPMPLMKNLQTAGVRLALPAIAERKLIFRGWSPGEPLLSRGFGTSEPRDDAEIVEPDIVLVPMLAFDMTGARVGYGKAYYDGGLARLRAAKNIIAIGLAFEVQCVDKIPTEPHDQKLDYVITEAGVRFAAGET